MSAYMQAVARDAAMTAHEATMVEGARVRVTRGRWEGLEGTVVGDGQGSRCVCVAFDGVGRADISASVLAVVA